MLNQYRTEQIGISAETAIADLGTIPISPDYRSRGRADLVQHLTPVLEKIFLKLPKPVAHTAADQNPVDFLLQEGKTLSVKTNMKAPGKVAPQNIGQPSSTTFWTHLPHLLPKGVEPNKLSYAESAKLFKEVAQSQIELLLSEYWNNLFDCDYLIYIYNILNENDELSTSPKVLLIEKSLSPRWANSNITFTRNVTEWNESCTVKYKNHSIGEFQVHNNRDCFKFRFNMNGLIQAGIL